jgi:hypothetical protein
MITQYPPLGSSSNAPITASISQFTGSTVDAFGRLRVSNPYTLFDSQARYAADSAYSYATATGGTTSFNTNKSSVNLNVTTTSGSSTSAQTFRVFPYQPGKSLLTMQTFTLAPAQTNLVQRVGYFNANNGIYLEQGPNGVTFVIRTYTSGSVDSTRYVAQANWNVDKFNGTGPSGVTLDLTKTQILFMDCEWLGVGNVALGFVANGVLRIAHVFQNANTQPTVYMQTAILPLRYEISNTGTTALAATLQQICSTVISEGGYEQTSQTYVARNSNPVTLTTANLIYPIASFKLNSSYLGAIVLLSNVTFQPVSSGTNYYEIFLVKNATLADMTTTAGALSNGQVDLTLPTTPSAPTAITLLADSIVFTGYASAGSQSASVIIPSAGFNWDLQLGVSQAGVSDTYTLAARSYSGGNVCYGSLSFYNLTT